MNTPYVSVVMASYNTDYKHLYQAVSSVLEQTYKNFELIVIDDCSSNRSVKDVIKELNDERVLVISNDENVGLAVSLNKGIDISRGKYIVRMDSDDICIPRRIEQQVAYMEKNDKCDIMSGRTCLFDNDGNIWMGSSYNANSSEVKSELLFDSVLLHPSVIIRKSFLDENKLRYNEECRRAQDYMLWYNSMMNDGNIISHRECYLFYRQHDKAASSNSRSKQLDVVSKIHEMMISRLLDNYTPSDMQIHNIFCNPQESENYDCRRMKNWMLRLITANEKKLQYEVKTFKLATIKRYLTGLAIHRKKGNISNRKLFSELICLLHPNFFLATFRLMIKKIFKNVDAWIIFNFKMTRIWKGLSYVSR